MILNRAIYGGKGDFLARFSSFDLFFVKYIALAVFFAVCLPRILFFIKERVRISTNTDWIGIIKNFKIEGKYADRMLYAYAGVLFLLNFIRIFDNVFWYDECYTLLLAHEQGMDLLYGDPCMPPLYFFILKACCEFFVYHPWVYHLSSLIAYLILMFFALFVISKRFGKEATVILISLISLAPVAVHFNVEVRVYSWALMFTMLSFYELHEILCKEQTIKHFILFYVFSICAAYTHYYGLLAVAWMYAGLILIALIYRKNIKKTFILCLMAVVTYLPWVMSFLTVFNKVSNEFWIRGIPKVMDFAWYLFTFKSMVYLFFALIIIYFIKSTKILKVSTDGNICFCNISLRNFDIDAEFIWVLMGLSTMFLTVGTAIFISEIFRPLFTIRYIYLLGGVAYLLFAILITKMPARSYVTTFCILLFLFHALPAYKNTLVSEMNMSASQKEVLRQTQTLIKKEDKIFANHIHLVQPIPQYCVLQYYYPNVPREYTDLKDLANLKYSNGNNWLIIRRQLNPKEISLIKSKKYDCDMIVNRGNLGTYWVWIYKITKAR